MFRSRHCFVTILIMCMAGSTSACTSTNPQLDSTNVTTPISAGQTKGVSGAATLSPVTMPATELLPTLGKTPYKCLHREILLSIGNTTNDICFDDKTVYFKYERVSLKGSLATPLNGWYLVLKNLDTSLYNPGNGQTISLNSLDHIQDIEWATLSPDRQYIAYVLHNIESPASRQLFFANLPTFAVSTEVLRYAQPVNSVYPIWYPSWSPVGGQLAISDNGGVYIVDIVCNADTHQCHSINTARRITATDISIQGPVAWSAQGIQFLTVCITAADAFPQICVFDMHGSLVRQFNVGVHGIEAPDFVTWSPDGAFIAFQARDSVTRNMVVYVLNSADLSVYTILSDETRDYQDPMWMP